MKFIKDTEERIWANHRSIGIGLIVLIFYKLKDHIFILITLIIISIIGVLYYIIKRRKKSEFKTRRGLVRAKSNDRRGG
jgi:hypothetical protein